MIKSRLVGFYQLDLIIWKYIKFKLKKITEKIFFLKIHTQFSLKKILELAYIN